VTAPADQPTPPARKQFNVRLPVDLIEAVDARRARKDLSRDKWVENALRFALAQHPTSTSTTPTRH
jgi:predicted HicB family RNase H-like nuclease